MLHDIKQINSLEAFIKANRGKNLPYDLLYNMWIYETGNAVHDADTVDYYMNLIPMIVRRLSNDW